MNESPRRTNATGTIKKPQPNRDRAKILKPSPATPALPTKLKMLKTANIKLPIPQILFLVSWEISNFDSPSFLSFPSCLSPFLCRPIFDLIIILNYEVSNNDSLYHHRFYPKKPKPLFLFRFFLLMSQA